LADYNANIRVNADTKGAESQLKKLQQSLNKLSDFTLKLNSRDIGREVNNIGNALRGVGERGANALRGIGERGALGAVTLAAGKATTAIAGLGTKFGLIGAAAASAGASINGALGGIPAVVGDILNQVGQIPNAFGIAAVAAMAFAPQLTKAAASAVGLGAAIDNAVGATAVGKIANAVSGVRQLDIQLNATKTTFAELLEGSTLNQLNRQLQDAVKQSGAYHSSTTEAVTAARQLLSVQKELAAEQKALNDIYREAQGLRPEDVENKATNTYRTTQNRKKFFSEVEKGVEATLQAALELDQTLLDLDTHLADLNASADDKKWAALEQQWKDDEAAAAKLARTTQQLAQALDQLRSKEQAASDAARGRLAAEIAAAKNAAPSVVRRPIAGVAYPNGPAGPGGNSVAVVDAQVNAMQLRDADKRRTETQAAIKGVRDRGFAENYIAGVIERRLKVRRAELDIEQQQTEEALKRSRIEGAKARNQKMESVALGVGFPLLFGGGAGSVLGSLAGSFVGSGFGGQILGGAIGQALDQFITGLTDVGKALKDPTEALNAMAAAGLRVSDQLKFNVEQLTNAGRSYEAQALVVKELNRQFGPDGARGLAALAKEQRALGDQWESLATSLRSEILPALIGTIVLVRQFGQALGALRNTKLPKWLQGALDVSFGGQIGLMNPGLGLGIAQFKAAQALGRKASVNAQTPPLSPQAAEAARKAAEQQADSIRSAYREGFQLQRRAADINTAAIDYRRRIESDIFAKRQETARLEIDNARKAAQVRIDANDLALRKQFAGTQGETEELLNGVRNYIAARRNAEADIEQQRRSLEVSLADINKATSDYVYEQAKSRLQLERQIEDYKMDVADYQLKTTRQIQEQQRLDRAAQGISSTGTGAAGFSTQQLNGATQAASRFNGVANMCAESVKAFYKSLGVSLPGVTAWADTVRKAGTVMKDWSKLKPGDIVATGRPGDTSHVGVYTGGNNVFHQSASRGLSAGNYPDLNYFKQGGYFVRPNTTSSQLANAASQVRRPSLGAISGDTSGMAAAQAGLAAAKKQEVSLTEKLSKLKIDAAAFDLQQLATGKSQTEQLRQQVLLEGQRTGALSAAGGLSKDAVSLLMSQLEGESQIGSVLRLREQVLLKINDAAKNNEITAAEEKSTIDLVNQGVSQRLTNTREQVALQQQLLRLAQEQQFLQERAGLQSQLGVIGTGGRAGFTGGAASAYETALMQYGDPSKAKAIAELTQQIDIARMHTDAFHNSIQGIGTAFGDAMTTGVSAVAGGTAGAREVFAQFLNAIANSLMQTAAQMIATYTAIGIARMFAGVPGASSGPSLANLNAGAAQYGTGSAFTMADFGGFRAAGGPVTGGTPYLVGEKGPELFVPGRSGGIVPNNALGGGGGDTVVNGGINITVENTGDRLGPEAQKQIARQVQTIVMGTLVNERRSGGVLR
jgi:cell wall-associated NlpC family hydrolase